LTVLKKNNEIVHLTFGCVIHVRNQSVIKLQFIAILNSSRVWNRETTV